MTNQVPLLLTLCLEENTILVSTAILECLGNPRLIQMMINDEMRSLIIHPCKDGDRESILIPESTIYQFEYPGQSLLRRIRRLTKWRDTNPRAVYGTFVPQINAVVFDLLNAQVAILQPNPDEQSAEDSSDDSSLLPGIYTPMPSDGVVSACNTSADGSSQPSYGDQSLNGIVPSIDDEVSGADAQ